MADNLRLDRDIHINVVSLYYLSSNILYHHYYYIWYIPAKNRQRFGSRVSKPNLFKNLKFKTEMNQTMKPFKPIPLKPKLCKPNRYKKSKPVNH